jgi:hypothetical protein
MEAARTSETLVNFYQTTRCYNPEDSNLHTHRREKLKSYFSVSCQCCFQLHVTTKLDRTEDCVPQPVRESNIILLLSRCVLSTKHPLFSCLQQTDVPLLSPEQWRCCGCRVFLIHGSVPSLVCLTLYSGDK